MLTCLRSTGDRERIWVEKAEVQPDSAEAAPPALTGASTTSTEGALKSANRDTDKCELCNSGASEVTVYHVIRTSMSLRRCYTAVGTRRRYPREGHKLNKSLVQAKVHIQTGITVLQKISWGAIIGSRTRAEPPDIPSNWNPVNIGSMQKAGLGTTPRHTHTHLSVGMYFGTTTIMMRKVIQTSASSPLQTRVSFSIAKDHA